MTVLTSSSFQAAGNICATRMPGNCPSIEERRKGDKAHGVPKESSSLAAVRAGCVSGQQKISKDTFPVKCKHFLFKTALLGFSIFPNFKKISLGVIFRVYGYMPETRNPTLRRCSLASQLCWISLSSHYTLSRPTGC